MCALLHDVDRAGSLADVHAAAGVEVLAHELMHLAGGSDEAVTQCLGLQQEAALARILGVDPKRAQRLADQSWEWYPSLPSGYRTTDCGPGRPLDRRTDRSHWP